MKNRMIDVFSLKVLGFFIEIRILGFFKENIIILFIVFVLILVKNISLI